METRLVLQVAPILFLLVASCDGFFFGYPKKVTDLLHLLGKLKPDQKKAHHVNNVNHYHMHYYPTPVHVVSHEEHKAPEKRQLDDLYDDHIKSLGWSNYEYKHVPETKITVDDSFHEPWSEDDERSPWEWAPDIIESDHHPHEPVEHHKPSGLLVQVPLHQQIIIQHPREKKEPKKSLLTAFIQKLGRIKNAIFHDEEDCDKEEKDEEHKVHSYVVYLPPKATHFDPHHFH